MTTEGITVSDIKWLCCECGPLLRRYNPRCSLTCKECGKQRWAQLGLTRIQAAKMIAKFCEIDKAQTPQEIRAVLTAIQ